MWSSAGRLALANRVGPASGTLSVRGQIRNTNASVRGDLPSPALCPVPAGSSSGSSCAGNTLPFQAHLDLDNSRSFSFRLLVGQ